MKALKQNAYQVLGSLYQRTGWGVPFHGAWISKHTLRSTPSSFIPYLFGSFERTEWKLAKKIVDSVDAIVDVGAGTGALSVALARRASNNISHIAVEANPELLDLIGHNAKLNDREISVIHAAVSYDNQSHVDLNTGDSFLQSSLFARSQHTALVRVPSVTFKEIFDQHIGRPIANALVVMDIEGSEVDVLSRDLDVISRSVAHLVVEFHPKTRGGEDVVEWAVETLAKIDFYLDDRLGDTVRFSRQV